MNQIRPNLWIGNKPDACNIAMLMGAGITAVHNVAIDCNDPCDNATLLWIKTGLIDGPGNHMAWVRFATDTLISLLANGHKVMLHCIAGHSRAPYVCARALAAAEGTRFAARMDEIIALRPGASSPNRLVAIYGTGEEGLPAYP